MSFTNVFATEANRMQGGIAKRQRITSAFSTVMKKAEWPREYGHVLTSVIQERTIPGTNPEGDTGWTAIAANADSNTCVPTPVLIGRAMTTRTWQLYQRAYNSEGICMDDLRAAYEIADQAAGVMDNFEKNIIDIIAERDRASYTSLAGHKVIAGPGFPEDPTNFPAVAPGYTLNQSILAKFRKKLVRDGAGEHGAYAKANGAPVFLVFMSSEMQEQVFLSDANVRNDVRWAKPDINLQPFGIDRSYGGFFHMIDDKMPRWELVGGVWTRVPYYITAAANIGTKAIVNPDYENATYEDVIFFHPDVTTRHVPTSFGGAGAIKFAPQDYGGRITFKNIPHATDNPDENNGFFRAVLQMGYKPNIIENGYVLRALRCPATGFVACS